jgi:hypothetical protein
MWHGEAFRRLRIQGVEVLILVVPLFPPSLAPASQKAELMPSWILLKGILKNHYEHIMIKRLEKIIQ